MTARDVQSLVVRPDCGIGSNADFPSRRPPDKEPWYPAQALSQISLSLREP
jgi:hypothetical protein